MINGVILVISKVCFTELWQPRAIHVCYLSRIRDAVKDGIRYEDDPQGSAGGKRCEGDSRARNAASSHHYSLITCSSIKVRIIDRRLAGFLLPKLNFPIPVS